MRWGGRGVKRKSSKQAAAAGAAARPVCVCMLAVDVCRLIRAARSVGCGRLPRVYLKKFCRHPGDGVGWGARLLGEAERRRPQEPTQTGTATTNNRSSGEPAAPAAALPTGITPEHAAAVDDRQQGTSRSSSGGSRTAPAAPQPTWTTSESVMIS